MKLRRQLPVLAVACVLFIGGYWAYYVWSQDAAPRVNPADDAEWNGRIAAHGVITFRSWNGEWIGADCDTEISFQANEVAFMTEYGDGVSRYRGTYRTDANGLIEVQWNKFADPWPLLVLERDAISLRLRPQRGRDFGMAGRHGAAYFSGDRRYWPFRPVPVDEERPLREERDQRSAQATLVRLSPRP